jgi:hypothetical protein
MKNINWATYEPVYAGAPVNELLQAASTLDSRHWANLEQTNRLQMALADMQFHDKDKPEMSELISGVSGQIQDLVNQPTLARSGNQINKIATSLATNPKVRGGLQNKMYIDAKKAEIEELYRADKYDSFQRDHYLREVEEEYEGAKVDEYGMNVPYEYQNPAHFFDLVKFGRELATSFTGDVTSETNQYTEDRTEGDTRRGRGRGGDAYQIKETKESTTITTPGDDFEAYYRESLKTNPNATAYIDEIARLRGVDPLVVFNDEVKRARRDFENVKKLDKVVELEKNIITGFNQLGIDDHGITRFDVDRSKRLTDVTSYRQALDRAKEHGEQVGSFLGENGILYDFLSEPRFEIPGTQISAIKQMVLNKLDKDERISLLDFQNILGDKFDGLSSPLANYTVLIENIRNDQRVLETMIEDISSRVLSAAGFDGDLETYLQHIDEEGLGSKAEKSALRQIGRDRNITAARTGSYATTTRFENMSDKEFKDYDKYYQSYIESNSAIIQEINRQLKDYAAPFSSGIGVHDFGLSPDLKAYGENLTQMIVDNVDGNSAIDVRFLLNPDKQVDINERNLYKFPDDGAKVYWVTENNGDVGLAFRVQNKEDENKSEWFVTYAFSNSVRTNLVNRGIIAEPHLKFMSLVNDITKAGGSGEIPMYVDGKLADIVQMRSLTKTRKDEAHVGTGGIFEMKFTDVNGNPVIEYPRNYFEAYEYFQQYKQAKGYGKRDYREGSPDVISALPESVRSDVAFTSSVAGLADKYNIPESWLYALMDFESDGTFDTDVKNKAGSSGTGLIQIIDSTARGDLGTNVKELAKMSRGKQMEYVQKYFETPPRNLHKRKNITFADLYMAILWPTAIGKPDNHILFREDSEHYEKNSGLDVGKKGYVTKGDAVSHVLPRLNKYITQHAEN